MQINFAHLQHQGINFVVFAADARARTAEARSEFLAALTDRARRLGLRVDKSALAYRNGGRNEFWGTRDLVQFLANNGVPRWTHVLTLTA